MGLLGKQVCTFKLTCELVRDWRLGSAFAYSICGDVANPLYQWVRDYAFTKLKSGGSVRRIFAVASASNVYRVLLGRIEVSPEDRALIERLVGNPPIFSRGQK
jgi:hypothetical protein